MAERETDWSYRIQNLCGRVIKNTDKLLYREALVFIGIKKCGPEDEFWAAGANQCEEFGVRRKERGVEPGRALLCDQRRQNQPNSHLPHRNHRRAQGQGMFACVCKLL